MTKKLQIVRSNWWTTPREVKCPDLIGRYYIIRKKKKKLYFTLHVAQRHMLSYQSSWSTALLTPPKMPAAGVNPAFVSFRNVVEELLERDQTVQPQKRKKKQSMEIRATDSKAVTRLHSTLSTTEKSRSGHRNPRLDHLGEKYEETSSGHRKIESGGVNSSSSQRNIDHPQAISVDFLSLDSRSLSLPLSQALCVFAAMSHFK